MSTRGKIGLGLAATIAGVAGLLYLGRVLASNPTGPPSSSYATTPGGVAALAELLGRADLRVRQLRQPLADLRLDPGETVFALDATSLRSGEARVLRSFVEQGGRLVVSGPLTSRSWLGDLLADPPTWSSQELARSHPLASTPQTSGLAAVVSTGPGSWESPGSARPLLGADGRALLVEAHVGSGTVELLATTSPLTNELLSRADDAALGVRLAGGRPVDFLEGIHGYGPAAGYAALPARFWAALAILGLAAAVFVAARFRRLGPPELRSRPLPPARTEYVEALGHTLALTRDRSQALEPLRSAARAQLAALGGVADDDTELRALARELGFERDADALMGPARDDASALALAHTAAKIRRRAQGVEGEGSRNARAS